MRLKSVKHVWYLAMPVLAIVVATLFQNCSDYSDDLDTSAPVPTVAGDAKNFTINNNNISASTYPPSLETQVVPICTPGAVQSCAKTNGAGVQACNSTGSGWGTCVLGGCYAGYQAVGETCVAVQAAQVCSPGVVQNCPMANGTGVQACNSSGSGWGTCVLGGCNPGYNAVGETCVDASCTGSYTLISVFNSWLTGSGSVPLTLSCSGTYCTGTMGPPGTTAPVTATCSNGSIDMSYKAPNESDAGRYQGTYTPGGDMSGVWSGWVIHIACPLPGYVCPMAQNAPWSARR